MRRAQQVYLEMEFSEIRRIANMNKNILRAFGLIEPGDELYHRLWATDPVSISPRMTYRIVIREDGLPEFSLTIASNTTLGEIEKYWSKVEILRRMMPTMLIDSISPYLREILRLSITRCHPSTHR
jgi:hypothetical protein